MSAAERARLMFKLADLMEENQEELAQLETLDNGKPINETTNADIPSLLSTCAIMRAGRQNEWTNHSCQSRIF